MLPLNLTPWTNRVGLPLFHFFAFVGLFSAAPSVKLLGFSLLLYSLRGFGITVGYHRYFTHESFRTSRPVAFFLALLGVLAGQGTPSWWVYRHRMHHRFTDRVGDPHSPKIGGFFHAHMGWILEKMTLEARAGQYVLRESWPVELRLLDRIAPLLFLGQGAVLYGLGGWTVVAWAYFIPTVVSWHLTFLVNSLCHQMGDRPFDTQDESRNNVFFAALMFGEGWHNNHHAWPRNARLGLRPLQIDFGFYFIRLLKGLGLIWDVHLKSEQEIRTAVKRYSEISISA